MSQIAQAAVLYEVAVEHATLALATLSRGAKTYAVRLAGGFDDRWIEIFQRERRESRTLSRFELDAKNSRVCFAVDPGADPADVIDALELLDELVARVNERAIQAR